MFTNGLTRTCGGSYTAWRQAVWKSPGACPLKVQEKQGLMKFLYWGHSKDTVLWTQMHINRHLKPCFPARICISVGDNRRTSFQTFPVLMEHRINRRASNAATNSSNYIRPCNITVVWQKCFILACVSSISHPPLLVLVSVNNTPLQIIQMIVQCKWCCSAISYKSWLFMCLNR